MANKTGKRKLAEVMQDQLKVPTAHGHSAHPEQSQPEPSPASAHQHNREVMDDNKDRMIQNGRAQYSTGR